MPDQNFLDFHFLIFLLVENKIPSLQIAHADELFAAQIFQTRQRIVHEFRSERIFHPDHEIKNLLRQKQLGAVLRLVQYQQHQKPFEAGEGADVVVGEENAGVGREFEALLLEEPLAGLGEVEDVFVVADGDDEPAGLLGGGGDEKFEINYY